MSDSKSIWEIIKDSCKKCFETETSTEAGRINLFGSLICAAIVIIAMCSSFIDKIIFCFNKNYELGIPWYGIIILVIMFLIYFIYCVRKISSINSINSTTDVIDKK